MDPTLLLYMAAEKLVTKVQIKNTVFTANHGLAGLHRSYSIGSAVLVTESSLSLTYYDRNITGWFEYIKVNPESLHFFPTVHS